VPLVPNCAMFVPPGRTPPAQFAVSFHVLPSPLPLHTT
jgi:hypothetical protein